MCKEYNGWANYETWVVNLWLDNDQGTQEYCYEIAANNPDSPSKVGQALRDMLDEMCNESYNDILNSASLFSDLLGAAFSSVDWYELGESWIEGAKDAGYIDDDEDEDKDEQE